MSIKLGIIKLPNASSPSVVTEFWGQVDFCFGCSFRFGPLGGVVDPPSAPIGVPSPQHQILPSALGSCPLRMAGSLILLIIAPVFLVSQVTSSTIKLSPRSTGILP